MKKAARIVIIIDMILFFWCITPLIFGFKSLKLLKTVNDRSELKRSYMIWMLIFGSTMGGVLMLCMTKEQWEVPLVPPKPEPVSVPEPEIEEVDIPEDMVLPELIADIINVEHTVKFSRKEDIRIYQERLYKSSADLKRRYAMIDSVLYALPRVRVNYSSKYQTFKAGSASLAKLAVKNDAIYVYLALDPKDYAGSNYVFKDVSETAGFAAYPMRVKVTSDKLVDDVCALIGDAAKLIPPAED